VEIYRKIFWGKGIRPFKLGDTVKQGTVKQGLLYREFMRKLIYFTAKLFI
jgi:hypothetical protein